MATSLYKSLLRHRGCPGSLGSDPVARMSVGTVAALRLAVADPVVVDR